jgi:hypothetical protein
LPPGYRLELVLSEPHIREPVAISFDGNGRMYVVEMRSYMQDIDGTNQHTAVGRVSLHESTRRDGRFDKHSVYTDKLMLPRMLLPLDDRVIIGETDTNDLYVYRDTNRDGVADTKEIFYQGGPRGGNLEHQPNGLLWSIDNWLYSTYNSYRLRVDRKGMQARKEPLAGNGGQWGVTQDDFGKVWMVNAGGERGPRNMQAHIRYAAVNLDEQFGGEFREVFPLVGIPDVQGGKGRFRPNEKTLAVASYVRNSFGNRGALVTVEDVARLRAKTKDRSVPWTRPEVEAAMPRVVGERGRWKVSASHNALGAMAAIDDDPDSAYATGAAQTPDMWFQIELPKETTLSALALSSGRAYDDFPRAFEVRVSRDGRSWGDPVATGHGTGPAIEVDFAPAKTRHVKINLTKAVKGKPWSVSDLRVMGPHS